MRKPLVLWMSLAAAVAVPACAQAQAADTVLVNGKIITLDGAATVAQGLAIRDGMVLAVGSNDEMKRHAEPGAKIIDLGGRTAVPGLMDSHIHALRAGLTYSVELSWIGVPSLAKVSTSFARRRAACRRALGSRSAAAGPNCSFPSGADRRSRNSRRPRPIARSMSSASTTRHGSRRPA